VVSERYSTSCGDLPAWCQIRALLAQNDTGEWARRLAPILTLVQLPLFDGDTERLS
jgi:hypothetical protein